MLKAGKDPMQVIKEISSIFPWNASVSAEVVGDTAEEMLDMAEDYLEIGPNITIKVPCTVEGLKACRELADDDEACKRNTNFYHGTSVTCCESRSNLCFSFRRSCI